MTREQAKQTVYDRFRQTLKPDRSGKGYICPISGCTSGTGSHGTGITENPKQPNHFTCWAGCFKNADAFKITAKQLGMSFESGNSKHNFEVIKAVYNEYGIDITSVDGSERPQMHLNGTSNINTTLKQSAPYNASEAKYGAYMKTASKKFKGSPAEIYINNRGISSAVAERFNLGYSENEYFPNNEKHPALIIPVGTDFFIKRNIEQGSRFSNAKGVSSNLFNSKQLTNQQDIPVFITESVIDALSIIEAGCEAIGLNSTSNVDLLVKILDALESLPPFILCLDTDEAGDKATEKLSNAFKDRNLRFIDGRFIIKNCNDIDQNAKLKDANEALVKNRSVFIESVAIAKRKALNILPAELEEYEQQNAASYFASFANNIEKSKEVICTGFNDLDNALDGGLYSGLYFIGAISSLGKTTFCLQIADQIAKQKQDVLIFSLEMARDELMAKSVSRLTFINAQKQNISSKNAKSVRGISDGRRWQNYSQTEKELIHNSMNEYQTQIAPNIWIFEGVGNVGVKEVREKVSRHISLKGRKPLVLIDYAQILAPFDIRATDKQNTDKAVLELKRLSRDFDIPVLCVSSLNRESYTEPISMRAFKESGAIEYGSDVLLGLQYSGMDYDDGETEKTRFKRIRSLIKNYEQSAAKGKGIDIQLKVLKNRNGKKGTSINFVFYPMFNYFSESDFKEIDESTPFDMNYSPIEL